MRIEKTPFRDLLVIYPVVFRDDRGSFMETWNEEAFREAGIPWLYKQDNQSTSSIHVLRGLHFQAPPREQGKLIRVIKGSVLDVVVDLRRNEPTYRQHFKMVLQTPEQMLYIPPGFAHGFLTLEKNTVFAYKCSQVYNRESERSIYWNDPDLGIDWGVKAPVLSQKDQMAPPLSKLDNPF
jgi:dTDP-4-dehydrorhamnose 3,5-epimerase